MLVTGLFTQKINSGLGMKTEIETIKIISKFTAERNKELWKVENDSFWIQIRLNNRSKIAPES